MPLCRAERDGWSRRHVRLYKLQRVEAGVGMPEHFSMYHKCLPPIQRDIDSVECRAHVHTEEEVVAAASL